MAVTSARSIVNMKEKGRFEHTNENERMDKKYTMWSRIARAAAAVVPQSKAAGATVVLRTRYLPLADELPSRLSGLQLRHTMQPSYCLRRLTVDDKEAVLDFLGRFFFRDEPMNQAVNLLETPESRCVELEEYAAASLDDGISVATVDDTGAFVGVVINGLVRREDADYTDKSEDCANPKFRRILKVLSHLNREARIWDKLPASCHTVVEVRIVSTHTDWRGRGLMRALCEETERLALMHGATALRMDTTSAFSAAAAERLQYKKVYSVAYKDLDYAPHPDPPHLEARVYIKEL